MQHCQLLTISIDGMPVQLDDLHHELVVRGRRLSLRPPVYFLTRALVLQRQAHDARQCRDQFVSYAELSQETGAMSRQALRDLAFETRHRLRPHLDIDLVYGKGYFIVGAGDAS
jgi:hypothetical protein